MKELVFLLEEPSAKRLLQGLLPRILPSNFQFRYIVFEGKQHLEKHMGSKLRAWQTPGAKFVVLRDQDSGDCKVVKQGLVEKCAQSNRPDTLVRVACRELEAWIVGDLAAFAKEFTAPQAEKQKNKGKFVDPDTLADPVKELRVFCPEYKKGDGAERMGLRLDPETNQSGSFRAFCDGVLRLAAHG